ncbi:tyrosine-protein phosphatase [Paraglaciecola hydrolytica]|uniref:protein-tyrosine-phosphatase n=1 Tax=Paraglaciecola hydrolytica TaxID=1799789 RepID=A0A148KLN6_9ALTE|nr:CpsB/CapC family capsule biosynthesis tyrosine phosphatase [Paraglaciecola hydrolytica]KXI27226.1 tyrosine protein phosphatase [Paraglaciecola hydrolytica]
MIDIHSHILPGVDDGARTLDEALDMLRMAVDTGVTIQVLTPHIHYGRYENQKADLQQRFAVFQDQVDSANIKIGLQLGSEVRIGTEIMQLVAQDAIPTLGVYNGKKTFLLEFPRIDVPVGYENLVKWLINKNYLPIIVHPERNQTFVRLPQKLKILTDMGCPLQITASSLTGLFGEEAQQNAELLLQEGRVSAIASDCHNLKGRKPNLNEGVLAAQSLIGASVAETLVTTVPNQLIANV